MIKLVVPAVIIFLIILFWEKICEIIYRKFNIRLNYLLISVTLLIIAIIILLIINQFMNPLNLANGILVEADGIFTLKNQNTTLGFVRFNEAGEIEYIFVNPLFRKKKLAKNLLKLVREKTQKKLIFQKPISPLGSKLLKSIENWN